MDELNVTRALLPLGYSFVPKGNVFVTANCRRRTQAASRMVYVVFKGKEIKEKIGIGVPTGVFLQVQLDEMKTRAERSFNVRKRDETIAQEFEEAVMKEYPSIPADAVPRILQKALEKGKGKVGRTRTLDISRKAILAVRAHIRHCYTGYDTLLKGGMSKDGARREVAARVQDIDGAWNRKGHRASGRDSSERWSPERIFPKIAVQQSRQDKTPAGAVQAATPKPRSTERLEVTEPLACQTYPSERYSLGRSPSDTTTVDSAMLELGETRRRKILNLDAQIHGHARKERMSGRPIPGNSAQTHNSNAHIRITRRRERSLMADKRLAGPPEEVRLQPVETSEAMGNMAEQLRSATQEPAADLQALTPQKTLTHHMRTGHTSEQSRSANWQNRGAGSCNPENADVQGEPQNKSTRVIIDLIGDSDDDDIASAGTRTAIRQKRNKTTSRARVVGGRHSSDAAARELGRELQGLGVGRTVQTRPLKRHASVEANRVLSKHSHSHKRI
ncbi:hypothetical protein VPNG_00999 [Cytospora leucostoma]|uniref:DUF2293 domain-containing protein n=1 Tax=Cytospora leucostoma TaxID=1230097 RepID=A0A423XM63_9PEZI|nr:hypothetical protein VPNG_00999 [Cytospora leucostoma]